MKLQKQNILISMKFYSLKSYYQLIVQTHSWLVIFPLNSIFFYTISYSNM